MVRVYSELRGFVLAHGTCVGPRRAETSLPTPAGYSVRVKCGCGVKFTCQVTSDDVDEDRLRSALLALKN